MTEYSQNSKAILAGDDARKKVIIVAGSGLLAAGTILGRITVDRKYTGYDSGAENGSEIPVCVLLEDVDATDIDVEAVIGLAGCYVKANMTGLDQAAEDSLEARGLYFL